MVQIMGFWPILTIFWSGFQKFKWPLRRVENELGAKKNNQSLRSLDSLHINFKLNRIKSRKVQGDWI